MITLTRIFLTLWLSLFPSLLLAQGNTTNDSFQTAKHYLSEVYKDHTITFYCGVEYSEYGEIRLPEGFSTPKYESRVELADVIIRIMDAAKERGWRVAEAVVAKAQYNKTRPFKHGGKGF